MKAIKITDAKNNLSRHLQYVRGGGRIRILDRDTPVADIVPVELSEEGGDSAWLEQLERDGIVRRGAGGPVPPELLRPGPKLKRGALSRALEMERRSTR